MKINRFFLLVLVVPMCAFGADRGDGAVRTSVNRVGLAVGKAKPVATNFITASNLSGGIANKSIGNFELSDDTAKQIGTIVSNQIIKTGNVGKVDLVDADKKKIGDLVSAQIIKDKGLGKIELDDADKKQIGDFISKQIVVDNGIVKLELNDIVKKQIGDLLVSRGGAYKVDSFFSGLDDIGIGAGMSSTGAIISSSACRDAYRECMDNFCLLDENQGERCACSDNINRAKSKLQEILDIQAEADKLFTEDVEREKLDTRQKRLVFTESTTGNAKVSGKTFMSWLYGSENGEVGEDSDIGDVLYSMAASYCADELDACGDKAEMEEMLYTRLIAQDCKSYDGYLKDQKANAESNKRIAEAAVRAARLGMLDTTNKYNRGECLLAYRSCIADKGGCGANFENCLDASLLRRRSNACDNILDQCTAVRDDVKQDWEEESRSVLAEAAKYTDKNMRETCLARIQDCLEENCSTSTTSECLTDTKVAANICPVIKECNAIAPGLQARINAKLGYLRLKFCENDVGKCLQEKCGVDFTKPECIGQSARQIAALCPQEIFPSCDNVDRFDIIVQSALLQIDYQMLQGCINYFDSQLSLVCGMDMKCLSVVDTVLTLTELPADDEVDALYAQVKAESAASVDNMFKQFEKDKTIAACADTQSVSGKKVKGKSSLGDSVFNTAKWFAIQSAENRNLRALEEKLAELTRDKDLETARQTCLKTYRRHSPGTAEGSTTYIKSVAFEPSLRNCHVCRIQRVCEEGGESGGTAALKGMAGGLSAGAGTGTMINAGWGTAIGAAVGMLAGGLTAGLTAGKKEFCQEVETCEDINM